MKYLELKSGNHIMNVSKIVLGTDYFGTTVSKDTAFQMMDSFIEAGGNCIDTARVYAQWLPGGKGASEKVIGEWLKSRGIRDKVIISTKGGHPPLGKMDQGRLSRECIESDLDESLKALQTDYIDIYWLHRDDIKRPVEDIMETLHHIVKQGKVRAVGCSNWKVERIEEANNYALSNGCTPFVSSQIQWSLASSTPEMHDDPTVVCMDEHEYSWYLKHDMSVMAFSAQAKGFFSVGILKGLYKISQKAAARFGTEENIRRLERVKKYAQEHQLTPAAVVLGYLLCNQLKTMAIVGCKTMEQLNDSLTAKDVDLPESAIHWLLKG